MTGEHAYGIQFIPILERFFFINFSSKYLYRGISSAHSRYFGNGLQAHEKEHVSFPRQEISLITEILAKMQNIMKKHYFVSALILTLFANIGYAKDPSRSDPAKITENRKILTSGIATQYIDPSVRAQDNFYEYINGKWLKSVEIPADKSRWGTLSQLQDQTLPQLREIIEKCSTSNPASGTDAQRIGDFYDSFMDETKLEKLRAKPLNAELQRIAALKDITGLPELLAHLGKIGVNLPFSFSIRQDNKDSTQYIPSINQDGLGMPDRDYYLKANDQKLVETKAAYQLHVERSLALAGYRNAAESAKAIVEFETAIAKVQWSQVELRDAVKAYNKVDVSLMQTIAPGFDWKTWLDSTGLSGKTTFVIVGQPSYLKAVVGVINNTSIDTWKAYLSMHLVDAYDSYLSKDFVDERFDFYDKTLSGVTEQEPRWKRGIEAVDSAQGEALGKLYVAEYFPPERKARMETLVKNLLAAYSRSIDHLDWMSAATKREAHAKLAKLTSKIGYPSKWKDYSALVVSKDDLVGNVMRARVWAANYELNKLGKSIDRDEWNMTPQTVNAYYSREMNTIVFPAAILQPPFFDANADDAVNYGGIGAVIGHEISHGFDDQGAQYDGDGNLRDWWTPEDHKNFADKTEALVAQYNALEPIPGYHVNGTLTLGENIADNSGLAIAYKAYHISLNGKKTPVIDGMSGDQRLYAGWAQVWHAKTRDAQQIVRIKTDPHSPEQFRTNATLRNQPNFYKAFKVREGDRMYLAPKHRVIIW